MNEQRIETAPAEISLAASLGVSATMTAELTTGPGESEPPWPGVLFWLELVFGVLVPVWQLIARLVEALRFHADGRSALGNA